MKVRANGQISTRKMHNTQSLQAVSKPLQPYKMYFVERIPVLGKNFLEKAQESLRAKRLCIEETERLFACLRKWEMDNLQCVDATDAMLRCAHENAVHIEGQRKRIWEGKQQYVVSSEGSQVREATGRLMLGEIDKLFRKYKQPDIGMGFRPKQRMSHVPYWANRYGGLKRDWKRKNN